MKDKEELLKAIEQKQQEIRPIDTGEMKPTTIPSNLELGWLNALKWMKDLINSLPVEQSTEQLCWNDMTEKEKSNFFFDLSHQKQIEQPIENLEEVASRYAKEEYSHKNPATLPDRCRGCYAPLMYAFKNGANWQEEYMMKSAVDATCVILPPPDLFKVLICHDVTDKLDNKQKVKILIVENDDR